MELQPTFTKFCSVDFSPLLQELGYRNLISLYFVFYESLYSLSQRFL